MNLQGSGCTTSDADWTEYAPPNTVNDIVLFRGRAAAKALKLARERRS